MSVTTRIRRAADALLGRQKSHTATVALPSDNWFQLGHQMPYTATDSGPVLEACVAANAQTAARLPLYHMRTDRDGTVTRLNGTRVAELLRKPNHYQTRSDFILNLIRATLTQGNGYVVGVPDGARTFSELHLLDPRTTIPAVVETEVFYSTGSQTLEFIEDPERVIPARYVGHVRLFTPRDPLRGVSPIEAVITSMAAHNAITGSQAAFFRNMARPSGVLRTEKDLSAEQMNTLRNAWREQSAELNKGGVPILSNGLSWEALSVTSQDAQLADAWKMSVEDVARAFRVPPPIIGHMADASFANVGELMSFWLQSGLGFILDHVENALTDLFDLPVDQRVQFDESVLLRMDQKARVESLTQGITGGLFSPNEARRREGLPPVAGGDEPRVQMQQVPLSWTPPEGQATTPTAVDKSLAEMDADDLLRRITEKINES